MKRFFRFVAVLALLFIVAVVFAQDSYRIIFLGDTHFDGESEIYHPKGISKPSVRDINMWKKHLPELLTAAGKKVNSRTAFVLQGGDMIEGGGGTAAAHRNMLVDGYKKQQSFFSVPFITAAGNHDVSSRTLKGEVGSYKIYQDFVGTHVLPAVQNIRGMSDLEVNGKTNFAFRYGKDLYMVLNFNGGPSPEFIRKILTKHADARYKIALVHAGPIPWDVAWMTWRMYGRLAAEKRAPIIEMFRKHNCIFLTGHYHGIATLEYAGEDGSIFQIMCNSVWTEKVPDQLKVRSEGVAGYGKNISRSNDFRLKSKSAEKQALIDAFKPGLKSYYYAGGAGYMTLDIEENKITLLYYHGASDKPSYTFTIPKK